MLNPDVLQSDAISAIITQDLDHLEKSVGNAKGRHLAAFYVRIISIGMS